jgi:hypothetical protein
MKKKNETATSNPFRSQGHRNRISGHFAIRTTTTKLPKLTKTAGELASNRSPLLHYEGTSDAHTLGLLGSEEEEGAARGNGDDGDPDGHRGLDALPLQEIHGRGLPYNHAHASKSVGGFGCGQ